MRAKTKEEFLQSAVSKWGNVYDYSSIDFRGMLTPITLICPKHGNITMTPVRHLGNASGCNKCGKESEKVGGRITQEDYLQQCVKKHKGFYTYDRLEFKGYNKGNVTITCPIHGDFEQDPRTHKNAATHSACPDCYKQGRKIIQRKETAWFISEAVKVHGDRYDYSITEYVNQKTLVDILCRKHGVFPQNPSNHLSRRSGCPKCAKEEVNSRSLEKRTLAYFCAATKQHGGKYIYTDSKYRGTGKRLSITCPIHGVFEQLASDHKDGHECPFCAKGKSQYEDKLADYLDTLGVTFNRRDTSGVAGKGVCRNLELDMYLPGNKLAIEINGEWWHSSQAKGKTWDWVKNHQKTKTDNCSESGVQLLHFYTEEIEDKFEQVKGIIAAKLGVLSDYVAARKTKVRDLDWAEAKSFQEKYHIQGAAIAAKSKGLFFDNELVAVMVFGRLKSHRGNTNQTKYELIRYCSSKRVIGGCSKLLKAFIAETPDCGTVVSYSDNRHSNGKMYESMGFELMAESSPDYMYISNTFKGRKHKSNFRRANLAKILPDFNPELTERENCHLAGYYQLYDAGKKRWELTINP